MFTFEKFRTVEQRALFQKSAEQKKPEPNARPNALRLADSVADKADHA